MPNSDLLAIISVLGQLNLVAFQVNTADFPISAGAGWS